MLTFSPRTRDGTCRTSLARRLGDLAGASLPVILLVAWSLVLGTMGGTPRSHPDTLIHKANYTREHGWNPRFSRDPGLVIYLHGVANGLATKVSSPSERPPNAAESAAVGSSGSGGERASPSGSGREAEDTAWRRRDRPGHAVTVLFSGLAALAVYATCPVLTRSRWLALLGGSLLVSSPLWNANTHFLTVDVPFAALCAVVIFASVYVIIAIRAIDWWWVAGLGVSVGVATAAKYNGSLAFAPVVGVLIERDGSWGRSAWLTSRRLALAGLASLIAFFLLNPFALIERTRFLDDLRFELDHASAGHFGYRVESVHHHLTASLRFGWGWPLIALSVWGALTVLLGRRWPVRTKVVLLAFPTMYAGVLASTELAFQRYAVPLIQYIYDRFVKAKVNFTKFADGKVFAITPFDAPREVVPFSPGSLYTPMAPDLRFRVRPGPYAELYVPNDRRARTVRTLLLRLGIEHQERAARKGFYYRSLAHRWPGQGPSARGEGSVRGHS